MACGTNGPDKSQMVWATIGHSGGVMRLKIGLPFQEVLQSIRYLLNRPLCFWPKRELAGRNFTD